MRLGSFKDSSYKYQTLTRGGRDTGLTSSNKSHISTGRKREVTEKKKEREIKKTILSKMVRCVALLEESNGGRSEVQR